MVGSLGPRVGGAHVDVNLKFDDNSINTVGKQIQKQLSSLGRDIAKVGDRNREVYRSIGKDAVTAWRAFLGAVVVGAPHVGSAISALSGAATMLAGSLYSTAQAGYALGPVLTSLGLAGLTLKVGMRGFASAVSETNPKALKEMLADMPKSMQNAVMATRKLSNEMRAAIWPKLFVGLSDGIEKLRNTGVIQRGLGLMADQLNRLAKGVLNYANSKQGISTLNKFFANNAKIFGSLSKAAVPFLDGFLRLMNALSPAALRLTGRITDMAKSFQGWTKEAGFGKRIDDMMKGAEKTAGLLWKTLSNLGHAIINVFNIANPSTNNFLQMLVDLTQRFEDFTNSAKGKNDIATWAAQSVDVMRQFGHTIEAVFKVIAALADPRVIISFLKTLQGAFEYLNKLPLEKIINAFTTLSEALQPVSSLFLAMTIGVVAFNILLGSLIGQMGGVFSVFFKLLKFKILIKVLKDMGGGAGAAGKGAEGAAKKAGLLRRAWEFLLKVINKVRGAFSKVTGFFSKTGATTGETASKVSRLGKVFKPVLSILGRFVKFAGFVGIAVWIGILIAKSKDLQAKLGKMWDAFKGVGSSLKDAFSEIGTALKPLAPVAKGAGKAFGFVFDILDKIATLAIGLVIDTITYALESLANVITGAGRIIAGLINVLVGLFTLDFGKVWDGLKQMFSGLGPLLKGAFGLFITFFAPARLAKLGGLAIKGLAGGLGKAMPGVLAAIGKFITSALKFFVELAPKLLSLGGKALLWLGKAIVKYAPKVLLFVGKLELGIIKFIAKLPGKLLSLGGRAIMWLGKSVVKGTPKVLIAAGKIYVGIIEWIMKLPGRLLDLGKTAVTKLGSAIRSGIGTLRGIAGDIVTSVVNIIKGLPGKLLNLAGDLLSAGKTLGGKILEGIRSGITAIGDMASSVAADLKAGINSAIGLPKTLSFSVMGKKIGFTIPGFEKGTMFAPGGLALVGEGGPELVNLPRGSRVHTNAESKKMMGSGLPSTVILRVGARDFLAYVEEVADDRINAADNLAWQGA